MRLSPFAAPPVSVGNVPALLLGLTVFQFGLLGCESGNRGIQPGSSPSSGSIQVSSDDEKLLIASEDHGELLIIDRASQQVLSRVATGAGAYHVVEVRPGTAVVTNRYDHSVSVVDTADGVLISTFAVGVEPAGLAVVDDNTVAVVLAGEESLALLNVRTGDVSNRTDLGVKDPRAVARLADGSFVVTHMTAGVMSKVNADMTEVDTWSVTTANEFGPQVHPNHLRTLTVAPDGESLAMAHSQANAETVRAPIGAGPGSVGSDGLGSDGIGGDGDGDGDGFDEFGGGGCGYSGCATELGAVVPAITEIDADTGAVMIPVSAVNHVENDPFFEGGGDGFEECFDCGEFGRFSAPNPPSILNPFESRFNGVDMNNPTAVAIFDGGRGQMIVNMGTKNVVMLRRPLDGTAEDVIGEVRVGAGATGIALTHDGRFAYVWNQFDGSVTEIEVPNLNKDQVSKTRFVEEGDQAQPGEAQFVEVPEFAGSTFNVVEDALPSNASLGRKLFHDATDARISNNHAISCASCHPDGRTDGRTWQFTFGPRNTPQLGGGILETAPFHWPGDVETHRDLDAMTVRAFMGGNGLDELSMDAIGAFIDIIPAAPTRAEVLGLTEAQMRGREIFFSAETGCVDCHSGTHYTDNINWNVETRSSFADISEFQTPVLHGLSRSGPYLHDGSALTLQDLVDGVIASDKMGRGSHLDRGGRADLAAFLSSL